jgi:excisionase family DNA binding protein
MLYYLSAVNEILTVAEAAQFLNKHPGTIRRWILAKKLKAKKIPAGGTGVFVLLKTDLLEFSIAKMVKAERKTKKEVKVAPAPQSSGQETLPI